MTFRSSSDGETGRCRKTNSIRFTRRREGHPRLRAPGAKRGRTTAPATLSARLGPYIRLEADADGTIRACFAGHSVGLGQFSAAAADRAQNLHAGLPLHSFVSGRRSIDKDIHRLVLRLARHGLLEYRLGRSRHGKDQVVIEPQVADYWPRTPPLRSADALVLSRFAYLRRRANELVLESPRAGALFRICDPRIAATVAALATPHPLKQFRRQAGFPGLELLALLLDCQLLLRVDAPRASCLRCGPVGLEKQSICGRFPPPNRNRSRPLQSCCASAIRPAASMTGGRLRSPSLHG